MPQPMQTAARCGWPRLRTPPTTDAVLTMKEDVHLYGGFAGGEATRDTRDWIAHETIIDGEDARRCVLGADNATLDGFTVRHGLATGDAPDGYGGGIYNDYAAPTVSNCTFAYNAALFGGGAMYNAHASPAVSYCIFSNNSTEYYGGAMRNSVSSRL